MNFKKYHVSRNLCDESTIQQGYYGAQPYNYSDFTADNKYRSFTKNLKAGTYTLNIIADETMYTLRCNNDIDGSIKVTNNPPYTFTLSADTMIYVSWRNTNTTNSFTNMAVMLNTGSTPLPYEPYSSEVWHGIPHYIMGTSTNTITTLPAVLYPNDTTATVGLKGNTVQNGTPTPTTPIQPQECGERTNNLIDVEPFTVEANDGSQNLLLWSGTLPVGNYTLSLNQDDTLTSSTRNCIRINIGGTTYYENSGENYHNNSGIHTMHISISGSAQTVEIRYWAYTLSNRCTYSNIILNTGSTALPYENFGYKIPISSANTTTPVYLGEVESTRRIKKLVLTGEETWVKSLTRDGGFYCLWNNFGGIQYYQFYCDRCEYVDDIDYYVYGTCFSDTALNLWIGNAGWTVNNFKSYLAQQYAAGTPVTVWYVLATPETGIVNEPLRKIGGYADEVSGITIPTIAGANTLSVGTTLQPSEVSVNYHGWHPVQSVHERENGAWT